MRIHYLCVTALSAGAAFAQTAPVPQAKPEAEVKVATGNALIKPPLEAKLREIIAKRQEIFEVDQEVRARQTEMEAIDKDQARLRENMKALKGSAEEKALLQRYTKQLDGQEDRLAALKKESADLQGKRTKLQAELEGMVQEIAANETL